MYSKDITDVLPLYNLVMSNVMANIFMNLLFQQMEQNKLWFWGRFPGHLIGYNPNFSARSGLSWRSLMDAGHLNTPEFLSFFFFFKTVCWKTLKRSVLPKGTAASDNNYLWVCHYKQPPSHYTSIFHCSYNTYWLVCGFKGKSIFLDSAFCADIQQSYLGKLY